MSANEKSYREIADVLTEMGICGITDSMLDELEAEYAQYPPEAVGLLDKTASLLTFLGGGEFDDQTGEWTPSDSGVYSFDIEVFNEEKIYTHFLAGVSAIGKGELDFAVVTEDFSGVDWEQGIGTRKVTFTWNDKTYTISAEHMHDWFDLSVADELNKIIDSTGGAKRLFFASDGFQQMIIFYCDEAWAKEFEEKTGCALYRNLA